jgi:malate synthase
MVIINLKGGAWLDPSLKKTISTIIQAYNASGVKWKITPAKHYGKAHLKKRQRRQELSEDWTFASFNDKILNIINGFNNDVHLHYLTHFEQNYFCFSDKEWIVIIGQDHVMETAMIGKPQNYFTNKNGYIYLGKVKDVFE